MYYNIVLNSLNADVDKNGKELIKRLACENKDLIESRTFPVVVCRYATAEEVSFYKELQKKYLFDFSFKEIKSSDNVFENFNTELKQGEQEDIHLKEKPEIINRLQDGLDVLKEQECCAEDFKKASEIIKSKIREKKENISAKFKPVSIYFTFVIWVAICALLAFSQSYTWETKIFICSCIFCVVMVAAVIYDFIIFKKNQKYYLSEDYSMLILQELIEQNYKKNVSIHRIENMIDTLQVRRCLTLLPTEDRNIEKVEEYLIQLNTLKSINEIFALH